MSTIPLEAPAAADTGTTDINSVHVWCHDPNTALCGLDVSNHPEVSEDVDATCVMCAELEEQPCPVCGNAA